MNQTKRYFFPRKPILILCGLLALAAPLLAKDKKKDKAGAGLNNAVVLVIRHGEKPDQGTDLSPAGQQRADAYVRYFEKFIVNSSPLKLDHLFAAADSKTSHRPRLTLEPLSKALGLAIDARYSETQNQDLAADLRKKKPGDQILICWHHQEIPDLLKALGAEPGTLLDGGKWPDNVYDWVVQLRYDSDGHVLEARRINEKLMPGDSDQ